MYYYTEDDILMEKISSIPLIEGSNYVAEIERILNSYSTLFRNYLPLHPYKYKIKEKINNVVILILDKNGDIEVNKR